MANEDRLHDVDRQVITALAPDDVVVRRVLAAGLQTQRRDPGRWLRPAVALAIAASHAATVGGAGSWRGAASSSPAGLTITGTGSSIIVERADGERWFFVPEPEPDASRGSYVIAIPNQGVLK